MSQETPIPGDPEQRAPLPARDPGQLGRLFAERASVGDLEGLLALYEDEATFVGPDGARASGRNAIRERLRDLLAIAPRITPGGSGVVIAGDVALISSGWRMTLGSRDGEPAETEDGLEDGLEGVLKGGLEGESTEVARRQGDGSWLYVIDNPTLAAAAPAVSPAAQAAASLATQTSASPAAQTPERPGG
jgi:ketosteroid isomerase-like protein